MSNKSLNRRLSAIMAVDVVGYSRLMADDEAATLAALNHHRDETFNPLVAQHGGRIVKLMGDGTLVEFTSVVDSVTCAMAIQQAIDADTDTNIVLRIGINLGDIILHGDDIYGDGVNIAARLEPLARSGGICISSIVNESVGSRTQVVFEDGGEVQVKNIDRPIRVWHWHPGASSPPENAGLSAPSAIKADTPSIAVLPFENMSHDPDQEYFSDGISEDIITDLSKVPGLLVIARNSSFSYKGRQVDLRTVGRELGVSSILEGSVRKAGNRVRITAQLIDARNGAHIWADRYDRDLTDIFAVQDEVTLEIVEALKIRLSPVEKASISGPGTLNLEAYDNVMRARNVVFSSNLNSESCQRVVNYGERAIELDPNFGLAYSLLSFAHVMDSTNNWTGREPSQTLAKAGELAARGVELAPNEPDALNAYALVARRLKHLEPTLDAVSKILSIDPNNAGALFTRGEVAVFTGRPAEGIPDMERAMRLDPSFRHQNLQFLGMAHLVLGNFETAELMFQERLLLVRDTDVGRAMLAATLGHLGEVKQARQVWQDLMEINPDFTIQRHFERMYFPGYTDNGVTAAGLAKAGLPL
jgi:adenylate cyclase